MSQTLLLDTCVLLWILNGDKRIADNHDALELLNKNRRLFSPVSIAEIELKRSIGKLDIADEYLELLVQSGIEELTYTSSMAVRLRELPFHHRDPFDRMLIATAIEARVRILTGDRVFAMYDVKHVLV